MNAGWGFHLWNPMDFTLKSGDFTLKSGRFHPWNLADFTQISPVKSTQNYKSKCFSKNSSVWWCRVGGYDQGFHEIHQISPWNLADLTCEIQWISHQISPVKSTQNYKNKCFSKNSSVWWMQGGGFHPEIWWISPKFHQWNPPKIIKASVLAKTLQFDECRVGGFHPWNPVDFTLKSGGFLLWNLVDFTQISPVKSTQSYKSKCFSKNSSVWWMQGGGYDQGFHEIHQISPWNLVDFTLKSGRFHPDFTCEIHPNYKSKCFSKNSSVWWMQGGGYDQGFHEIHQISPWNLADLTCEIQWISPRYHLWNPHKIIKASVSAKTLQFDECRVGAYDQGFHEIHQISPWDLQIWPVKSSGFHPDITCEIHTKL